MSYCPSQDWDRHCREQERPYPVGPRREVKSKVRQHCESCLDWIEPGVPHLMQAQLGGDDGLFTQPLRLHRDGECSPPPEDL
jgi:hypothetical protein